MANIVIQPGFFKAFSLLKNKDYQNILHQLRMIDKILIDTGVEKEFISKYLAKKLAEKKALSKVDFLTPKDEEEAFKALLELDKYNNLRKEIEKNSVEEIEIDEKDEFILVKGDYHEGVVGIVASRLVHKYKKPAIVFHKKGDILKGSGRSLGNIDIFGLINECKELLEGFGGHKMACGLSVKENNFGELKKILNEKIGLLLISLLFNIEFPEQETPIFSGKSTLK